MVSHTTATAHHQKPHVNRTTRTATIINALKLRALAVLNDRSLDSQSRAILRYALETNDPWLARLVRQTEQREGIVDMFASSQTAKSETQERIPRTSDEDRIEAVAEMICAGADQSPAALLVLMGMFETSGQPLVLANTVKHYAFTRCGELNIFGMVDAQVAVVEGELFSRMP